MPMHWIMASHASNKKVALKAKKASVTKSAKSNKRKTSGKTKKASTKKTAVKNKVTVKKAAKKKVPAKRKPAVKKVSKTKVKASSRKMADLDLVEGLVSEAKQTKKAKASKPVKPARANTPKTPSVPRTVKPTPKVVDVETDPEVLAFIDAIDKYKTEYSRPFPSWREVYYVFKQLGYERRFLRW